MKPSTAFWFDVRATGLRGRLSAGRVRVDRRFALPVVLPLGRTLARRAPPRSPWGDADARAAPRCAAAIIVATTLATTAVAAHGIVDHRRREALALASFGMLAIGSDPARPGMAFRLVGKGDPVLGHELRVRLPRGGRPGIYAHPCRIPPSRGGTVLAAASLRGSLPRTPRRRAIRLDDRRGDHVVRHSQTRPRMGVGPAWRRGRLHRRGPGDGIWGFLTAHGFADGGAMVGVQSVRTSMDPRDAAHHRRRRHPCRRSSPRASSAETRKRLWRPLPSVSSATAARRGALGCPPGGLQHVPLLLRCRGGPPDARRPYRDHAVHQRQPTGCTARRIGAVLVVLLLSQAMIGAGATVQRLYQYGPGHYSPAPLAMLDAILALPATQSSRTRARTTRRSRSGMAV